MAGRGGLIGKVIALLLAYMLVAVPGTAAAATGEIAFDRLCVLASKGAEPPGELIAQPSRFDCGEQASAIHGPVTWALFDRLNVDVTPEKPFQFRHSPHQFQSQRAFARLADGRVIELATSSANGALALTSEVIAYDLPAAGSPVTALLIREVGMQHQRGIAADARVIPADEAAREDSLLVLFYAVMAGAVFALLFFNAALYATLRYRFILANCAANAVILGLGMSWAGRLLPFMPELALIDRLSVVQTGIAAHLLCSALFLLSFIERDKLHRWAIPIALTPTLLGLGAAAMRLIDVRFQWELVDLVFYAGLGLGILAKLFLGIDALRRGSRAARILLCVLMVPTLGGLIRLVWSQQPMGPGSMFLAISPTLLIVLSALLDSLAVSWRIAMLRAERNHAFELAETDPMTGLFNRRAFVARAIAGDYPKQLVLIDIDRFKSINDCFGHQLGDEVIVRLAELLRATTPPGAVIGRLGGEEFAVLTRADVAAGLGESIRRGVNEASFPMDLTVSVSIGSTLATIENEQQWIGAYGAADGALYDAKRTGRNRVREVVPLAA